jgi:hypothetical protein
MKYISAILFLSASLALAQHSSGPVPQWNPGLGVGVAESNAIISIMNSGLTAAVTNGESGVTLGNNFALNANTVTVSQYYKQNFGGSGSTNWMQSATNGFTFYKYGGAVATLMGNFVGDGGGLTNLPGSQVSGVLTGWVAAQNFTAYNIARTSLEVVTQMSVTFPDGGNGVFLTTSNNPTWNTVDGYTCTYTNGSTTHLFTQPTILRDSGGAATNVPTLIQNN